MSRVTEYTCEGCGATSREQSGWSYDHVYGQYRYFCHKCSKRLKALMSAETLPPAPGVPEDEVQARVEAVTAPLRARIGALEDANSALQRRVADLDQFGTDMSKALERAEADRARVAADMTTERSVTKKLSARVAQLETDIQNAQADLSDARDENEHDAEVHRKVVWEILGMLGKKARKRNAHRIDEIALAHAGDEVWAPDDDGRDWSQFYAPDRTSDRCDEGES